MANLDAKVNNEIFRKDHPQILASNRHLATLRGVRLRYDSGGYKAGQVLGLNTTSNTFMDYNGSGSSGEDTAKCILFEDVPVEAFPSSTGTAVARGIFGGEVYEDLLLDLDSNAKTDLGARSIEGSDGVAILKF